MYKRFNTCQPELWLAMLALIAAGCGTESGGTSGPGTDPDAGTVADTGRAERDEQCDISSHCELDTVTDTGRAERDEQCDIPSHCELDTDTDTGRATDADAQTVTATHPPPLL